MPIHVVHRRKSKGFASRPEVMRSTFAEPGNKKSLASLPLEKDVALCTDNFPGPYFVG